MTLRSLLPKPSGFEILTVIMIVILMAVAAVDWENYEPTIWAPNTAHSQIMANGGYGCDN